MLSLVALLLLARRDFGLWLGESGAGRQEIKFYNICIADGDDEH